MEAAQVAPLSSMAAALFFGVIIMTYGTLTAHSWAVGDGWSQWQAASNPRSTAWQINNFTSCYVLLQHFSVFALILLYAYLCEYHPPYAHAEKVYDRDMFFFLTALLFVVSAFTLKSHVKGGSKNTGGSDSGSAGKENDKDSSNNTLCQLQWHERAVSPPSEATEVLNRDQTEEWKGWMQFMFLLYHYYHAEEVYNSIRIMITCYVWMTGFGNFSFFYLKQDYSVIRVLQMLWRLNFLVVFLCFTQGTTYILYYICLLHTFFFAVVYVTMYVQQSLNYTKWGIRLKLAVVALLIFFIWDVDSGIFKILHWLFLGETPMLGATGGAMWEWYFRSTLDHWSTFFGMLFALNFPMTSQLYRKLEAQPWYVHYPAKLAIAVPLVVATVWWVQNPFGQNKFDYNQTNAYYGWIPVYTYIYLRNITPGLRGHTLDLLHQIGKTTLETYLMQHHIWLTSNAKSLLTLIPGWPKMNFLIVSCIYVLLSRRLYQLTLFLRGMLVPNDKRECYRNLIGLMSSMVFCYGIVWILQSMQQLNLTSIAVLACVFSAALYRTILVVTNRPTTVARGNAALFLIVGALCLLVVGGVWNHMAMTGAGKIQPLPATCAGPVQTGDWVMVDCNEETRGAAARQAGMGSLGVCNGNYAWGWETAPSNSQCRAVPRTSKALKQTLSHRKIAFVGDSIVRHLYFALNRQLGDAKAGAYDTSIQKHGNFEKSIGSVNVEFYWASYVYELTHALKGRLRAKGYDLIVMGGGAWDRLDHHPQTTPPPELLQNITLLKQEMEATTDVPIVWVTPTAINSLALGTPEKKKHLPEPNMQAIRELYESKGVTRAADYTISGPSFTASRVSESYDGVHYPLTVYDAGVQILAQSLDWLLLPKDISDEFSPQQPGKMANPLLGVIMLLLSAIALFLFDGFMGASYMLACLCPKALPPRLYAESFRHLHSKMGLPPIAEDIVASSMADKSKSSDYMEGASAESDDERERFLKEEGTEMREV